MAGLAVEVERAGSTAVVRLDGDLDKLSSPLLRERLTELIGDGCDIVVIDAGELGFCDSSGLWVLLEAQRALGRQGGSLRLAHVHGVLRRVLDVTGLSAAFPPDVDPGTASG
ncbi:STAS domain-containing protein [Thermoactinospora rubra]|uniref:STAS domain-containing protein n=1 Tax=Thermoactinospora rubra TaxID=1088767 RepID=UPI001301C33F|nr:STAS domain-containing protein [Thermoactinospora rubra]